MTARPVAPHLQYHRWKSSTSHATQVNDAAPQRGQESGISGHLLAQDTPVHVGSNLFAKHRLPEFAGRAFDQRAILGRDAIAQPGLNRLRPVVLDVEKPRRLRRAAENLDCALCSDLGAGLVHSPESTQDNLVLLELLAFDDVGERERLDSMSIHDEIKRRRLALGWSHQKLADEVSAREHLKKPLAWQTVQQWENTASAPKRTRLKHVADALGIDLLELYGAPPAAKAAPPSGLDQLQILLLETFAKFESDFDRLEAINQMAKLLNRAPARRRGRGMSGFGDLGNPELDGGRAVGGKKK